MDDLYRVSKRASALYANERGDVPQQRFRYALSRFMMNGLPVHEAEAKAVASVRNTHPGFEPKRAD